MSDIIKSSIKSSTVLCALAMASFCFLISTVIDPQPLPYSIFLVSIVFSLMAGSFSYFLNTRMSLGLTFGAFLGLCTYAYGGYLYADSSEDKDIKYNHVTEVENKDELERFVDRSAHLLPMKIDQMTTLQSVDYSVESDNYVMSIKLFDIEVQHINTKAFSEQTRDSVLSMTCPSDTFQFLLEQGITVVYRYFDLNGEYVADVTVSLKHCQQIDRNTEIESKTTQAI
ncbi:hypothetical protein [Alteromonas antoniana]|uniref:hypothetical protein n=1 Tax=Alteromonas antoniana TaxID=2803813 RepID=UPI001C43DC1A|nr:hypothetical protein [Alteromonas antoniana]